MLTVAQADVENPELSMAFPQMDWFAPAAVTTTGEEQLARGYVPAAQVNVTVTFVLFQPLPFGPGEADAVMDGGTKGVTVNVTVATAGEP